MNYKSNSFEPRVGTMQMIFAIIYLLITLIALSLAFYTKAQDLSKEPYFQYFMAILFFILALKSFFIATRIKNLIKNGQKAIATVTNVECKRGITSVFAKVKVANGDEIEIESRYAGEAFAKELQNYLNAEKTDKVPALIVGSANKPRAMLCIKSAYGHLDKNSLKI